MNKQILKAWDKHNSDLMTAIKSASLDDIDYKQLLELTLKTIFPNNDKKYNGLPHYSRVTVVDSGNYQGTMIFVITADDYQPSASDHWYTCVDYGSCSGCDTLQAITNYDNGLPNEEQAKDLFTLCLHLMQKMKRMYEVE